MITEESKNTKELITVYVNDPLPLSPKLNLEIAVYQ